MPSSSAIQGIDCDMTRADCTPIRRSAAQLPVAMAKTTSKDKP